MTRRLAAHRPLLPISTPSTAHGVPPLARLGALAVTCAACSGSVSPDPGDGAGATPAQVAGDGAGSEPSSGPSSLARRVSLDSAGDGADVFRGGRLYDNFRDENSALGFIPDDAASSILDGEGGPHGDGTLPDSTGEVLPNALGHDYRAKNFFGWDLRGAEGVYGPDYQGKAYVSSYNLLNAAASREDVARLLVDGAPGTPAYGEVLPLADLVDLVAFVMAVRDGALPRPDDIWRLDASAPSGYVLASGANVEDGRRAIAASCANCHGADGTALLFDEGEHSLGTLARASAYEVWFKIVAGNPGSPMGGQVPRDEPAAVQTQMVLDVLAALCDRVAFPAGDASEPDVLPGDARCGDYLR